MNEEIKEILNKWKCYIGLTKKFTTNEYEMLRVEDIDKILDYITNLQNRIKELEEINRYHQRMNIELREENKRINKAIDYLGAYYYGKSWKNDELVDSAFNILQDKEEV